MHIKNIKGNHNDISRDIGKDSKVNISQNPEKKATKKATFVLPIELHKRLKTAAVEQDTTMLDIVEEALENHLKK